MLCDLFPILGRPWLSVVHSGDSESLRALAATALGTVHVALEMHRRPRAARGVSFLPAGFFSGPNQPRSRFFSPPLPSMSLQLYDILAPTVSAILQDLSILVLRCVASAMAQRHSRRAWAARCSWSCFNRPDSSGSSVVSLALPNDKTVCSRRTTLRCPSW